MCFCFPFRVDLTDVYFLFQRALEEMLNTAELPTTLVHPGPGLWEGFPSPEFVSQYSPEAGEDGLLMQMMVDHAQGTSLDVQGEAWHDAIIDGISWEEEVQTDRDYVSNNMGTLNDGMGQFAMENVAGSGFDDVVAGDFLEVNDILGPVGSQELSYPGETAIQLQPRRSHVTAMQMNSQGSSARRILLQQSQVPHGQVEDVTSFSNTWDGSFSAAGVGFGTEGGCPVLDSGMVSGCGIKNSMSISSGMTGGSQKCMKDARILEVLN